MVAPRSRKHPALGRLVSGYCNSTVLCRVEYEGGIAAKALADDKYCLLCAVGVLSPLAQWQWCFARATPFALCILLYDKHFAGVAPGGILFLQLCIFKLCLAPLATDSVACACDGLEPCSIHALAYAA